MARCSAFIYDACTTRRAIVKSIVMHPVPADAPDDASDDFSGPAPLGHEPRYREPRSPGRTPKYEAEKLWAVVKPLHRAGFSVRGISVYLKTQGIELSRERVRLLIASRVKAGKRRP
jgi:hypothetical protein